MLFLFCFHFCFYHLLYRECNGEARAVPWKARGLPATEGWSKRRALAWPEPQPFPAPCWNLKQLQFLLFPTCVCESSVLESCCFWLIKSCVCSKILHFLSGFGTTEGIRTLLIVYSLTVLYFVEGNWPSSCQHLWSQRIPQSCQGNSFCLGSCKRERDRNILWRTKGCCYRAQKHVCGPFTANTIYGWVRESWSHSQCNTMRWSFWEQHPDVLSGLESQPQTGLLFSVFVLLCRAILKYWHESSGFRLLGRKGSLVLFTT